MDLNEPPSADEDREERYESAVAIMRREREERRSRMELKRKVAGEIEAPLPSVTDSLRRPVDRIKIFKRAGGPLPEGWIECPSFGQPVACLIPSKVPLGTDFNEVVEPGKRYSVQILVRQQKAAGREVAMAIDLTNTSRYYPATEWKQHGIKYVKICCRGRDEVPENKSVNTFVYEVLHFFHSQRGQSNKYVLVHCTHGHNRTGFMIIHYLKRTRQGLTVEQALELFASARPPGIYKQQYIDSLFTFYNEKKPDLVVCPSTPEWKRLAGVDLNGEAKGEDDDGESDGGIMAALEGVGEEIMTNDDVLGDAIPEMQQLEMQRMCFYGLGLNMPQNHGSYQFPGSQPVSLSSSNLQLLRQRYYYATWKADGTRYMMFITRDGCYLVDRKFEFRRVQLRFPVKNSSPTETQHLTLLDGEMVIDTIPDTNQQKRRYLVYDIMMLNQESVVQRPFHERWKLIKTEVIEPRSNEARSNNWYSYDMEAFGVRRKDFWLLSTTRKLLDVLIPKLSHEADGLVFQGWDDPYLARTNDGLLKWKYEHMNSVDFKFEVSPDGLSQQLLLIDKNRLWPLDGASVTFPGEEDPRSFSGKIIECSWLPEKNQWKFMRIRPDKEYPNAVKTYMKVMESIQDKITQEVLLAEIQEILHLPMYEDRIQQDQQLLHRHQEQARRK